LPNNRVGEKPMPQAENQVQIRVRTSPDIWSQLAPKIEINEYKVFEIIAEENPKNVIAFILPSADGVWLEKERVGYALKYKYCGVDAEKCDEIIENVVKLLDHEDYERETVEYVMQNYQMIIIGSYDMLVVLVKTDSAAKIWHCTNYLTRICALLRIC